MRHEKYSTAHRLVTECNSACFSGPIAEALIVKAEDILGVRFPPSYRRFLEDFGCLSMLSQEIYGIVDEDLSHGPLPNGIWATQEQRKKFGLGTNHIILENTGFGEWYALDTSRVDAEGECPVVLLTLGLTPAEDVSKDFAEFFLQRACLAVELQGHMSGTPR